MKMKFFENEKNTVTKKMKNLLPYTGCHIHCNIHTKARVELLTTKEKTYNIHRSCPF